MVSLRPLTPPVMIFLVSVFLPAAAALAQEEARPSEPFAFEVGAINEGLSPPDPPLRLDTPRAALEAFHDAVRSEDFGRAGHVLNLSGIPPEEQAHQAPELALTGC
jgi:hypothetical protein